MKKFIYIISLISLVSALFVSVSADSFENQELEISNDNGKISVAGSFDAQNVKSNNYSVFLATLMENGAMEKVQLSEVFSLSNGANSFRALFDFTYNTQNLHAFLLTDKLVPICEDEEAQVDRYIEWRPDLVSFYDEITDEKYGKNTDYSVYLEDDSNLTLIDGITIASSLHAKYNDKEISTSEPSSFEQVLEMDDASVLVDLSDRNSVNLGGINFTYAEGGIDEDEGYLYCTSTQKSSGGYDPQVVINGLLLDTRNFNKITLRVKYENVPGSNVALRSKTLQLFFKTNVDSSLSESKSVKYNLKNQSDVTDWFEIELDVSSDADWNNIVTGIRIDPLDGNAKFYLDYVKFTKSENDTDDEWYDKYLDYAFENDILTVEKYSAFKLTDEITRQDFFNYVVKAYPEEYFVAINDSIRGIPDVDKNEKNSEVYLMLYRAGITLGFDRGKNFGGNEPLTRSAAMSIINRLIVPENRISGLMNTNWDLTGTDYDVEFTNSSDSSLFTLKRVTVMGHNDGKLKLSAQKDAYLVYNKTVSIDSEQYTKLRIRMKAEYETPPTDNNFEFFFRPEGVTSFSGTYCITTKADDYYLDAFGWYVFEIDLSLQPKWKGEITNLRFDLINDAGTYTLDYIRFLENPYFGQPSDHEGLIAGGYTATKLMPDGFENGFIVSRVDQSVAWPEIHGMFNEYCYEINPDYDPEVNKPMWTIGPWWQGTGEGFSEIDLIENRDTTKGVYTLADTYGVNTITYDPVEKSITQRLNATKIYNGKPHDVNTYKWWPHQLLDTTRNFSDYVDKEVNSADADRMFVELDIRLLDFKNTTNPEGRNVCSYLAYFYFRPKSNPSHKIWFGLNLFSTTATTSDPTGLGASTSVTPNWSPDSAAHQYMYGMPMAVVYGGIENSFNPSKGTVVVGEEWKHIRLDITSHIERAVEWANRDNIFGMHVTKEEMFFNGVNIGYEIHGNYDCTFEIKNFNMIAYNK